MIEGGSNRGLLLTVAALPLVGLSATLLFEPAPRLVWNVSTSVPVGLYRVIPGARPPRGSLVALRLPEPTKTLASERGYLPGGVPLIKPVAAVAGDRVCAQGAGITINGRYVASRLHADRAGRPLPAWQGCRRLGSDELFLFAPAAGSFDGRYFGVSNQRNVIGPAWRLWPA